MTRTPGNPRTAQRGVTLIELMIAITLVAVIATGMLYAMRTSLLTYEKINTRLGENRRAVEIQRLLARQIGGLIPATGACGGGGGGSFFAGDGQQMRMISAYSMEEGARGYPQILLYNIAADPSGGFELIMREHAYTGPLSTSAYCGGAETVPDPTAPPPLVLASHLAFCRFTYHDVLDPRSYVDNGWVPGWSQSTPPSAIRVEMAPLPDAGARLPSVSVTVPIRIDRDAGAQYGGP